MTIGIGYQLSELTGIGAEYLLDLNGNVLAAFYNGNLSRLNSVNGKAETVLGVA